MAQYILRATKMKWREVVQTDDKKEREFGSMYAVVQRFVMLIKFYIDRYGVVQWGAVQGFYVLQEKKSINLAFCMIRVVSFKSFHFNFSVLVCYLHKLYIV